MTIEEQMYDEIMHKMPHRIAELVKTIDTIHKMLEAKHLGALSDNLDQLKKTLEQMEHEYSDIYGSIYVNNDFEALLPETTEVMKDWLKNDVIDYPNTCIGGMQGMLNYNDYITDRNKLTTYHDDDLISFRDNEFRECKWLDGAEQSEEFKTLCKYYYNEEYDIEESGTLEDNYIKGNGDFDFYKFESETNFTQDIADPYFEQMINDPDIKEKIEQTNEKIYNDFDERMKAQSQEQEYNNLYDRRDFEALLPQTFNDITEDFIDSGYIENKINEMTPGTEMDCYTPLKEYDRKMSFDLYDNFFNFSQNEDFKSFCEYYYNEEYDIEESGTFEDNYIDENGIFDFKKFCDNTYFKSDIMDDMTLSILNSEKVCEATEKAKEIRLEQYADEIEIQTEMEQYHDDEEQTQEQDIDTFINSYDDIQATILYTNGDGNHINEIKCISDGKMLTLDVSKMNLASDTPPEKLEQITKNIIASTKAKDPIIKPEPIKQNNDFER